MPAIPIQELKDKFSKGDTPKPEDFADLLDSCYNYSLSSLAVSGAP